jgi:hypothetical protein
VSRWDDNIKMGLGSSHSYMAADQLVLGVAPFLAFIIKYQAKYDLTSFCHGATVQPI